MSRRPAKRSKSRGRSSRSSARKSLITSETLDVIVQDVGAQGDGVASWQGKKLYIPGVLAGEKVRVKTGRRRGDGIVADLLEVLEPSTDRAQPPCPYFGTCGGCQLQHLKAQAYADWKRERVARALAQRGFDDAVVLTPVLIGMKTRRRVTFTAQKVGQNVHFGFNERASHDIQKIKSCPLLVAGLDAAIDPLKALLKDVLQDGVRARVFATWCENGVDVLIEGGKSPDLAAREAIASFVNSGEAVRVSWQDDDYPPEPIAMAQTPMVNLSGVLVELPMGGFLQASIEGEQAILAQVLKGVEGAGRIADLYCGLGSFTLALSRQAVVRAVDMIDRPIRALERAAGRADLGGRVVAEVRDLDRQPIDAKSLSKFDAVLFDPPRVGAVEQVRQIAASSVPRVVAVSCNPASFARDARILVDGGYRLIDVLPVDQFTFSAHVELVARFER
ncbi:MAG: class I SAM-dependent RNA methyltransferase [Magnetovibrio sp.]|nr:class I SAM-dependent RNA methyltransferase [Magnetovibrio sp.]